VKPHQDSPLLEVDGLRLDLVGADRQPGLLDGVSFSVSREQTVALIGESGCGKTMTAMAVLSLLPRVAQVMSGEIRFQGANLLAMGGRSLRRIYGAQIGTVFQNPMSSLNPTMRVGKQIAEMRQLHVDESGAASRERAIELLRLVGVPRPDVRVDSYPYELSGGMQQRVMIAMAIACEPQLMLADEPTTALDVTIQAEVLDLLRSLRERLGMGILLVTHDLGVVADFADVVVVMYAGQVVEQAPVHAIFERPTHPYTAALLASMPQIGRPRSRLAAIPGRVPPAGAYPSGCRFRTRCAFAKAGTCDAQPVDLGMVGDGHATACLRVLEGSLDPADLSGADQRNQVLLSGSES